MSVSTSRDVVALPGWLALSLLTMSALASAGEVARYFPSSEDADPYAELARGTQDVLARFGEPTLCCSEVLPQRGFRFTWLRSFDHPVVIRIDERVDGKWELVVKMAKGQGSSGSRKFRLIHHEVRVIDGAEVQSLLDDFAPDAEFWRSPTWSDDLGLDGATWLIEAHSNGRYHHVSRWSPKSGLIRELGLRFLSVAHLSVERVY